MRGRPIDRAYAEDRMRNERLIEIAQTKGQSETHPLLSPNDDSPTTTSGPFCSATRRGALRTSSAAMPARRSRTALPFRIQGLRRYKFGFGAASNSHSTGVPYRQDNYFGTLGGADGSIERRMSGVLVGGMDVRTVSTAGLTGVWAEENTRESIFNGMQRKETFASAGRTSRFASSAAGIMPIRQR